MQQSDKNDVLNASINVAKASAFLFVLKWGKNNGVFSFKDVSLKDCMSLIRSGEGNKIVSDQCNNGK
jgi:hypothetical protein